MKNETKIFSYKSRTTSLVATFQLLVNSRVFHAESSCESFTSFTLSDTLQ